MQQLLLAGLVGCWLASFGLVSPTSAVAAPGAVRAGSISAGAKPLQTDTLSDTNTYNPTLMARRQPQPMMASESVLPEEIAPTGPTGGLRLDNGSSGSLLDEIEPPKPIVSSTKIMENPVMDEGLVAEMPAEPWSSGSWFFSGHRYLELDFLVFERSRPRDLRTVIALDTSNTTSLLRTYSQTFGVEPGMRVTLGQNLFRDHLNRDHSVELSFVGINKFEVYDGLDALANDSLFLTNIAGFNASDTVTTNYSGNFISYEMNYRLRTRLERDRMVMGPDGSWIRQYTHGHTFSFLFGLRHLTLDEDLSISSRRTGVAVDTYSGDNRISTENDLLGAQIGGEMRSQYETWSWGILGKAGAYVNFAEVNRQIFSNNTLIYDVTPGLQDGAFLGELSFFAAYNLSPNWTLRASLDMMLVAGAALAPENIDYSLTTTPDVRNAGTVELLGLSFGMEAVW